jgi:hypothetical protein
MAIARQDASDRAGEDGKCTLSMRKLGDDLWVAIMDRYVSCIVYLAWPRLGNVQTRLGSKGSKNL